MDSSRSMSNQGQSSLPQVGHARKSNNTGSNSSNHNLSGANELAGITVFPQLGIHKMGNQEGATEDIIKPSFDVTGIPNMEQSTFHHQDFMAKRERPDDISMMEDFINIITPMNEAPPPKDAKQNSKPIMKVSFIEETDQPQTPDGVY